jgi:tetratricopeptide (TPR) repeat protein
MIFMDAKNYIHLTDSSYDVIINDSIHPRLFAENASLYAKEYFETAREHLNDNGLFVCWVPTNNMPVSALDSIVGTMLDAFPYVTIWHLNNYYLGYFWLVGSEHQQYFSPKYIENKLLKERVRESLSEINVNNSVDVLGCYIGDKEDLRKVIKAFSVNSDYWPFVEFITDSPTPGRQTFRKFVMEVRSDSVSDHIDWKGFSEQEKEKWVADYTQLYKASTYLLKSYYSRNLSESLKYSMKGLSVLPDNPALLNSRAKAEKVYLHAYVTLVLSGQMDKVLALASEITEIYPQSVVGWMLRSRAMREALLGAQKRGKLGIDDAEARLKFSLVLKMLHQALIIDKKASFYGPDEAVRFAKWFSELTGYDQVRMLDTLATVYAAAGRLGEAIDTAERALELASSQGQEKMAERIRGRLLSFKAMRTSGQQY